MLAIGFVLLVGIAGTTYGLIQAYEKADLADDEKGRAQRNEKRALEAEEVAEAESQRARDSEARAKFQLANARWETSRAGDARNLLQEIPDEYRNNFESNFCNRRFQGSDITCYGHLDHANYVVFSPDGTRIATGSSDVITLWDAESGSEINRFEAHASWINDVCFSPDGRRIASCGDDTELFSKEYTTGTTAWAVYNSTAVPTIKALGNKVRFAFTTVHATGSRGPDKAEGNFLDAVELGVGAVTAKRKS